MQTMQLDKKATVCKVPRVNICTGGGVLSNINVPSICTVYNDLQKTELLSRFCTFTFLRFGTSNYTLAVVIKPHGA